jgi:subtilisin-like proprotein convertase family protein
VPGNPRIEDLNLSVSLTHALMGDIDAALLSPAGNENSVFTDLAPTATGGQQQMDADFDDEPASRPFHSHRGMGWQTELNYRLGWFKGESAGGNWTLRLRGRHHQQRRHPGLLVHHHL